MLSYMESLDQGGGVAMPIEHHSIIWWDKFGKLVC